MTAKQVELIKRQNSQLNEKDFDLDTWKSSTDLILGRIYGEMYHGLKSLYSLPTQ